MPCAESPRSIHPAPFGDEGKMCQRDEVRLMSLLLEVPENSIWGKRGCQLSAQVETKDFNLEI